LGTLLWSFFGCQHRGHLPFLKTQKSVCAPGSRGCWHGIIDHTNCLWS
jgi:hypothetical protein